MPINALLDKIVTQAPAALAAMVWHQGQVYHNLAAPYDKIDATEILEALTDAYDLTTTVEREGLQFGDLVLGFDEHSLIARPIEGGMLVLLARQMRRQHILKLQVGLGVAARALARTLARLPADATAPETVVAREERPAERAPKTPRMYRGISYSV